MVLRTHIPKDDYRLPDHYQMTIFFLGEREPLKLEVSTHKIIDKVYVQERNPESGAIIFKVVGIAPVPLLEYETADDILGSIPLSSIKRLEFDSRWSEIRSIYEQKEKEKKENAAGEPKIVE